MPDMSEAFHKAGMASKGGEARCVQCGKTFVPREPHHTLCSDCVKQRSPTPRGQGRGAGWKFPVGYPDYFDADGVLRPEYITVLPEDIAVELGQARPKMTMHQLRAFYQHVKLQEAALENGRPFKEILVEVSKLKAFARERAAKEKVPKFFEEFISRNVDKSKDAAAFRRGFVEHFQAVVAYCAGTIR